MCPWDIQWPSETWKSDDLNSIKVFGYDKWCVYCNNLKTFTDANTGHKWVFPLQLWHRSWSFHLRSLSLLNKAINITSKHCKHLPKTISFPSFPSVAIKAKQNQTHHQVISSHLGPSSFQPPVFSAIKRQRSLCAFTERLAAVRKHTHTHTHIRTCSTTEWWHTSKAVHHLLMILTEH